MRGCSSSSWASASARPGSPGSSTRGASGAVGCRWMAAGGSLRPAIIAVCEPLAMDGSVLDAVRAGGAVSPSERHIALVSGGGGPGRLLDVLVSICGPSLVSALHVNYGLRGQESDADERHVRELCEMLGVGLVCAPAPPAPGRGNLQAWARDLRYAGALELPPTALIAPRHTASDQPETVLSRPAASPGRRALLGMAEREGRL